MGENLVAVKGELVSDEAATLYNAIRKQILVKLYVTPVSMVDKVYTTLVSEFVVH